MVIFGAMRILELSHLVVEQHALEALPLLRYVIADCYLPTNIDNPSSISLLIINDGQNMEEIRFADMLNELLADGAIQPVLCVALHADGHRKREYATAAMPDYAGRGDLSAAHQQFVLETVIPYVMRMYALTSFAGIYYAGFSLGGLSALDMVWNHPSVFAGAAVFSGSLWWRSRALDDDYEDDRDRIMHALIRAGAYHAGLRFYFTTGSMDEQHDRNNNGIIDSIDDTQDLVAELKAKGYGDNDITYLNYEDGQHDLPTWKRAFKPFLLEWFGTGS